MTDTALKPCPLCPDDPTEAQIVAAMKVNWEADISQKDLIVEIWHALNAAKPTLSAPPHPVETVQADVQPVVIQRYDSSNSCGEGIMVPHPNGDYVEYDHHATAIAQLEAERDALRKVIHEYDDLTCNPRAEKAEASFADANREIEIITAHADSWEKRAHNAEADRDKWHHIAMQAGVITHTDGTWSHPLRERCATAEASLAETKMDRDEHKSKFENIRDEEIRSRRIYLLDTERLQTALAECQREKDGLREALKSIRDANDIHPSSSTHDVELSRHKMVMTAHHTLAALSSEGA